MATLAGKKVLVTGGASGIGMAIVREFAKYSAIVGIHYYQSEQAARTLKAELAGQSVRAEIFRADLTLSEQAKKMAEHFARWAGGIDILVNNAGDILGRRKLDGLDQEFERSVMAVNFDSSVFTTQGALPHLKAAGKAGGASVVNIASLAARNGAGAGAGIYAAAKGAIVTWTKSMARELAVDGIRVNAICPGFILGTDFHATHTPKATQAQIVDTIPLKRAGTPEDIARFVVFLASETDGFATGAVVDINGGVW